MKATLDGDGSTLRLDFPSSETLRAFTASWRRKEGCLVRLAAPLKLWTQLTVELRQAGVGRLSVEARVVQVFGGGAGGFATALQALEPAALDEAAPSPTATDPRPAARAGDSEAAAGGSGKPRAATAAANGEVQGASPAFRIRQMNVPQKMLLASKASRAERQILLRDGSPQVLMGLLANPRIEDKEILALAKSSSASSGVLQRIAKDRRWSAGYEIRLALVKNPQTPTPLALRMLDTLRERDLRVLAKGSTVREAIRAAALRKIIQR